MYSRTFWSRLYRVNIFPKMYLAVLEIIIQFEIDRTTLNYYFRHIALINNHCHPLRTDGSAI